MCKADRVSGCRDMSQKRETTRGNAERTKRSEKARTEAASSGSGARARKKWEGCLAGCCLRRHATPWIKAASEEEKDR
eukprot:157378-Rhodomonas_salina.2